MRITNLFDYLMWRGDLSFRAVPFCAVDSLIFSCLAYIPFDNCIPEFNCLNFDSEKQSITLKEAVNLYLCTKSREPIFHKENCIRLLKMLAVTPRYKDLRLFNYIDRLDSASEKQFAAISIMLEEDICTAFRGTDSTKVGWKEDFNMAFMPVVPSQKDALCYLNEVAECSSGKLYVCGHSKGGNLAVYAAAHCNEESQKRILAVYNNDGPGFLSEIIEGSGYQRILSKTKTLVPQSSIVGMLLEHEEEYLVVHSGQVGAWQHNPFTWEIFGGDFVYAEERTPSSQKIDRALKKWLSDVGSKEREAFVEGIYGRFVNRDMSAATKETKIAANQMLKDVMESFVSKKAEVHTDKNSFFTN